MRYLTAQFRLHGRYPFLYERKGPFFICVDAQSAYYASKCVHVLCPFFISKTESILAGGDTLVR